MTIFSFIFLAAFATWLVFRPKAKRSGFDVPAEFPLQWRTFLQTHVIFYARLDAEKKRVFEEDVLRFLARVRITGIKTDVTDEDRLLVACSAVIPVFAFPAWEYSTLHEVLLYPDLFTQDFSLVGEARNVSGMVGSGGVMNNIVIFSKPALHQGFNISNDKKNVGIHEFVHLFDKEDGTIDGVPKVFMQQQSVLPWLSLMHKKTQEMLTNKSDINLYGATNSQEFLAVASEYFFERPQLLEQKHPELYKVLSEVFQQDLAQLPAHGPTLPRTLGRNDECPCDSGKKYKKCCMPHE